MAAREVIFLGTASQVPTRARNHNALFVRWDALGILIDPGEGTQRQLVHAGLAATQITHILITHTHLDRRRFFADLTRLAGSLAAAQAVAELLRRVVLGEAAGKRTIRVAEALEEVVRPAVLGEALVVVRIERVAELGRAAPAIHEDVGLRLRGDGILVFPFGAREIAAAVGAGAARRQRRPQPLANQVQERVACSIMSYCAAVLRSTQSARGCCL